MASVSMKKTENVTTETAAEVRDEEFTAEETKAQLRANEEDFIQGLIDAASISEDDTQRIEIIRNGRLFFAFSIRPLCSAEYDKCKKKYTKYVRNKNLGMKLPEDTDRVKYQSAIIYQATVDEDREKLWDNKKVWETLRNQDIQIMGPLDVIEYCLRAGEKDRVLQAIDTLSGYENDIEEVAKN